MIRHVPSQQVDERSRPVITIDGQLSGDYIEAVDLLRSGDIKGQAGPPLLARGVPIDKGGSAWNPMVSDVHHTKVRYQGNGRVYGGCGVGRQLCDGVGDRELLGAVLRVLERGKLVRPELFFPLVFAVLRPSAEVAPGEAEQPKLTSEFNKIGDGPSPAAGTRTESRSNTTPHW